MSYIKPLFRLDEILPWSSNKHRPKTAIMRSQMVKKTKRDKSKRVNGIGIIPNFWTFNTFIRNYYLYVFFH